MCRIVNSTVPAMLHAFDVERIGSESVGVRVCVLACGVFVLLVWCGNCLPSVCCNEDENMCLKLSFYAHKISKFLLLKEICFKLV